MDINLVETKTVSVMRGVMPEVQKKDLSSVNVLIEASELFETRVYHALYTQWSVTSTWVAIAW